VGTAYFGAVLAGLLAGRGRAGRLWSRVVFVGAAWSLVMVGAMLQLGAWCPWCAAVHSANLVLGALLVRRFAGCPDPAPRWQVPVGAAAGVLLLGALIAGDSGVRRGAQAKAEAGLSESTSQIVRQVAAGGSAGFEGRYRHGPEAAAVRVVVFTDYQCPDCRRVEAEIEGMAAVDDRLAVSVKQFPLSDDCNPQAPGKLHANACWAARAAEAAGIVGGPEAFWRMHRWLFAREGAFTEPELLAALPAMGLDAKAFVPVLEGPEVNRRIEADVKEGVTLGIGQTPMIFVNGVELRGWNAPQAVTRALRGALAASPAPATAAADAPVDAIARYMQDWRESRTIEVPAGATRHSLGSEGSTVTVVMMGDYREKTCAEADGLLRLFTSGPEPTIRYHFVQFAAEQGCNPVMSRTIHGGACLAARAAEAAAVLDGDEGYWRMHDWLMRHWERPMDEAAVREAAEETGFDPAVLLDAMSQPFVAEQLAAGMGLASIPMIVINGKQIARWKYEAENLLGRAIMEASGR